MPEARQLFLGTLERCSQGSDYQARQKLEAAQDAPAVEGFPLALLGEALTGAFGPVRNDKKKIERWN
jgi:hypothetical protein